MLQDLRQWLGPDGIRTLIGALVATGISSTLIGTVADGAWVITIQSLLALSFLATATVVIGTRMGPYGQRRLFFTLLPALGIAAIATIAPVQFAPFILGGAFGWVLAAQFFVREETVMEYKVAVRHMRNQEYQDAIKSVSQLVRAEPDVIEHLDFRARLFQLDEQVKNAVRDYEKITELNPDDPRGYSGLAGIYVQQGEFEQAQHYSQLAFERSDSSPAMLHDLALIEDRLGNSQAVINHIDNAIESGLRESRLLLLGYLWQARAYHHLDQIEDAEAALQRVAQQKRGFKEWKQIIADPQSDAVRHIYADDIKLAERVVLFEQTTVEKVFGASL